MKTTHIAFLLTSVASVASAACSQTGGVAESDTVAESTSSPSDVGHVALYEGADLSRAITDERKPLSATWALRNDVAKGSPSHRQTDFSPVIEPNVQHSNAYWFRTSADELAEGVALPLTSEGAVIQVIPQGVLDFDLDELILVDGATGRSYAHGTGIKLRGTAPELESSARAMIAGTTMFQTTLGAGNHTLRMTRAAAQSLHGSDVAVLVVEPETTSTAGLTSSRDSFLRGEKVTADASWHTDRDITTQTIAATVTYPSGTTYVLDMSATDAKHFSGALELTEEEVTYGALVEIEVNMAGVMDNGVTIRRSVRTAVAYALPTAAILEDSSAHDSKVDVGIEVGSVGRYGLSGVVYGTKGGQLIPFMMTQSARYLEPGVHTISLDLDATVIASAGVSAPFAIRDLTLKDQTRAALVYRQAFAIKIPVLD